MCSGHKKLPFLTASATLRLQLTICAGLGACGGEEPILERGDPSPATVGCAFSQQRQRNPKHLRLFRESSGEEQIDFAAAIALRPSRGQMLEQARSDG
jgi:hypothetical protein